MEFIQSAPLQPKRTSGFKKFLRWFLFICILVLAIGFWWKYYNVFGDGVKTGELNYIVKKGNIFKTYEGELILSGLRSIQPGSIQSPNLKFSVQDDSIANILMNNSGSTFTVHYKEYRGTLPWKGYSVFIVDEVRSIKPMSK